MLQRKNMLDNDKSRISQALSNFGQKNLTEATLNFFETLGYNTQRQATFVDKTPEYFVNTFAQHSDRFDSEKALVCEWKYVDLLFQITKDEITSHNQLSLFDTNKVENTIIESYLFFAIELTQEQYTRSALSKITREINKIFPMPVMLLFKHSNTLSLAVIDRRLSKRGEEKDDVLEKVTFIKDIRITNPHRAHIEILFELSFLELLRVHNFKNFVELHKAWRATLDISTLNRRFYRELSDWYFWAIKKIKFPGSDIESERSLFTEEERIREHNAKNLIRLLSRLLFVWFIKEKNLVPDMFFDQKIVYKELLTTEAKKQESSYYKAILQNLFFACLNQTTGKRQFRKDGQHRNTTTLMRYQNLFAHPHIFLETVETVVPFMNGGLFDCLDKPDPEKKGRQGGEVILYQDGFSDRDDNCLLVPDYIFFGTQEHIDLSEDYGDESKTYKNTTVKGLIDILKAYKFTITENTPLEEEVALDPELLGKVFENLLASYNPETRTTARNNTGSFYTPREIVDYMVNESLKAYLSQTLQDKFNISENNAQKRLDLLLMYTENELSFTREERDALIVAIDHFKIIDPACGSGAFPMGILHKLVYLLEKLDPGNQLWKQRQVEKAMKIDDVEIRGRLLEDIEESFANNEMDYGRKLYLIEQCIYGTDIQPIAVQISKLRFFISLIVDQKVDTSKENFGIRPLPNLESKFVTADSLVALNKPQSQLSLESSEVQILTKEIKDARHRIFSLKDPATKRKWRDKDKALRKRLCELLIENGWASETAQMLADWDPYDQNSRAPFFDTEWMFGLNEGFDVVIGNPPYIQIQSFSGKSEQSRWESQCYKTYAKTGDVYCLFYEKGFQLLNPQGVLCYITSNKWMRAGYGKAMRKFFLENGTLCILIDFGDSPIFENATTYTNITLWSKRKATLSTQVWDLSRAYEATSELKNMLERQEKGYSLFTENSFIIASGKQSLIKTMIEAVGTPLKNWNIKINRGVLTGLNGAFIIDTDKRNELVAQDHKSIEILKPILRGRDIKRYKAEWADQWLVATLPAMNLDIEKYPAIRDYLKSFGKALKQTGEKGCRKRTKNEWFETQDAIAYYNEFEKEKIIYAEIVFDSAFYYDNSGMFAEATSFIMTGKHLKYILALLNSKLLTFAFKTFYAGGDLRGNTFRYKKVFLEKLPIVKISDIAQVPYEILVDCILFARNHKMILEASKLEWLVDVMVFGLYFETEMKTTNCYINSRVTEVIKNPFKLGDSEDSKKNYIQKVVEFCESDPLLCYALKHCYTVEFIKVVLNSDEKKINGK